MRKSRNNNRCVFKVVGVLAGGLQSHCTGVAEPPGARGGAHRAAILSETSSE